jgi:hypothetical protein
MIGNPLEELRRRAQLLTAPGGELAWMATPQLLQRPDLKPWELQTALNADVAGILGHVIKDAPLRGTQSLIGNLNVPGDSGLSGEEKYRQMWAARDDPLSEALADIALDPWTYSGFGLFGKGKALGTLADAIPNPLVRAGTTKALGFLDTVDTGVATVSAQAMAAALGTPKAATKLVAKIPGIEKVPVLGQVGTLFDPSQQTILAGRVRDLVDMMGQIKNGGHEFRELARDLAESRRRAAGGGPTPPSSGLTRPPAPPAEPTDEVLEQFQAAGIIPPTPAPAVPPSAMQTLSGLWTDVRRDIGELATPEARSAAVMFKQQGEQTTADAYQRAFAVREEVRNAIGPNALSKATAKTAEEIMGLGRIDNAFARAERESVDVIDAVRYAINEVGEQFPLDPNVPPDAAKLERIDRALASIDRALTSWGPRIREATDSGARAALVMKRNQAMNRAVEALKKDLGPLPEDLVTRVGARNAELEKIGMGQPGFTANLVSRFADDTDLVERIMGRVEELGAARRTRGLPADRDLYDVAINEVADELATDLGLRNSPDVLDRVFGPGAGKVVAGGARHAGGLASGLWREFALTGPGYLVNNLVGGLVAGMPEGINPYTVARRLPQTVGKLLRREEVHVDDVEKLQELTGIQLPERLSTQSGSQAELLAAHEVSRRGAQRASEVLGAKVLGPAGAGLGAVAGNVKASLEDATPEERRALVAKGAAAGGVVGAGFPTASKAFYHLAGASETAMRESAYLHRATERIQTHLPDLMTEVGRVLAERRPVVRPGPGGQGRRVSQRALPGATQQRIMTELQEVLDRQGNLISPQTLQAVLLKNGVELERAQGVGKFWADKLDDASQGGLALANKIHFDYQDLTNAEQFIRSVMPFSTWSMKALPYFARHLAQRPGLMLAIQELNETTDAYKKEHGLTDRFTGGLPIGAGDALFSALLGRSVSPHFNLLRAVTPFGDVGRSMAQMDAPEDEDAGVLTRPLAAIESVLPGFNPLLTTAARSAGLLGNAAPRGLIGRTGPLEALTGINLNLPQEQLERTLRAAVGQEPLDYRATAIDKRIDELAVAAETTTRGKGPAAAAFQRAKVERKGEIYEQAKREVERESGVRALAGGLVGSLAPQAILPEEEARIRQARTPIEQGGRYGRLEPAAAGELRRAMKAGEGKAAASPQVLDATVQMITGLYGDVPPVLQRQLDVGTNERLQDIQQMLYRIQVGQEPLLGAYGPAGTSKEAEAKNLLAVYYNPAALLAKVPRYAALPQAQQDRIAAQVEAYQQAPPERQARLRKDPGMKRMLDEMRRQQEALRATNPTLDAYLRLETASKGSATLDDFLELS